jgi:hypothetical protein
MIYMNFPERHVNLDTGTTFEISPQLDWCSMNFNIPRSSADPSIRALPYCCHQLNHREKHPVGLKSSKDSTDVMEICCGLGYSKGVAQRSVLGVSIAVAHEFRPWIDTQLHA